MQMKNDSLIIAGILRNPLFVLIISALIVFTSFGIRQSFGLFLIPISKDLSWGRETLSFALASQNLMIGIAAPFAGSMLSDMGAEIIKIEPPSGDPWRYALEIIPGVPGFGRSFFALNRGKKGITLDLKNEKSQLVVKKLIEESDVMIINSRPDVPKKLKLDYEKIKSYILKESIFALAKSGTISLEICNFRIPSIIIYKMNSINFLIVKFLVKVKYANIVNIEAKEEIIPELLQSKCNYKNIFRAVDQLLNNRDALNNQVSKTQAIIKNFRTNKSSEIASSVLLKNL